MIATLDGREGHFAEAFAELAEAERLMHIWDVPPVYYLAMITLVKCELWLAQGRIDLAESWLLRLGQTYGGEQPAAARSSTRCCRCTSPCSRHRSSVSSRVATTRRNAWPAWSSAARPVAA